MRTRGLAAGGGFGVELAAAGIEAITLAHVLLPDVIVLDRRLPDLDGLEVARRLRASPRTRDIPILLLSGDNSQEMEDAARVSGCDARLVKPCAGRDLLGLIGLLARGRRETCEAAEWGLEDDASRTDARMGDGFDSSQRRAGSG